MDSERMGMRSARAPMSHRFKRPVLIALSGLSLFGGTACTWVEQSSGIEVPLGLVHAASSAQVLPDNPAGRRLTTSAGLEVELERAYVVISSLELVPCSVATRGALSEWARLSGVALAHGTGTPLRLADPFVNGLERPDDTLAVLGGLKPPPGAYCGLRVSVGPADADATGLSLCPELEGSSLLISGRWQAPEDTLSTSFQVQSSFFGSAVLPLAGLDLHSATDGALLTVRLRYDLWLDSLPELVGDPDLLALTLLEDILASAAVQLEPP